MSKTFSNAYSDDFLVVGAPSGFFTKFFGAPFDSRPPPANCAIKQYSRSSGAPSGGRPLWPTAPSSGIPAPSVLLPVAAHL